MVVDLAWERGERSGLAQDWTARNSLESVLKRVSDPEDPLSEATHCIVILGKVGPTGGTDLQAFVAGTKNAWESIGMMTEARHFFMRGYS